jgi:hypothetical protein
MKTPSPPGTAMQLSARDNEGRWILSVVAKRTYTFRVSGGCSVAQAQRPLAVEPLYDAENKAVLAADTDVWPFKLQTDVVVLGRAYNHATRPSFSVGVRVNKVTKMVQVHGDRRATVGHDGRILFSAPTVVEHVPLSYAFAYGGRDAVAEAEHGNPVAELRPYLPPETTDETVSNASPFVYPRSPAGRGYVVEKTKAGIEAARLPNLEHPEDLLSPERFVAGATRRWPVQPVPASLGWLDYGMFPRIAWLGLVPDYDEAVDVRQVGEIRLGYATAEMLREKATSEASTLEGMSGASLGLRMPYLKGGDEVELLNLNPSLELIRFRLPNDKPSLWVDGRNGRLAATDPVIHSVVIEPDDYRVTVIWRGGALARRPYGPDEIETMPFLAEW